MKFCPKCNTAVADEVIFCPCCGTAIDIGDRGGQIELSHLILSAAMPIYGFCYWMYKRRDDPQKGEFCLKISAISFFIYFGLFAILLLSML